MGESITGVALACALIAAAAVLFSFVAAAMRVASLPARIPVHFDLMGRPDVWGGRRLVWLYPLISLLMLVVLALVALAGQRGAGGGDAASARTEVEVASVFAAYVAVLLLVIMLRAIAVAEKRVAGLGRLFLPLLLLGVVLIVICYRV